MRSSQNPEVVDAFAIELVHAWFSVVLMVHVNAYLIGVGILCIGKVLSKMLVRYYFRPLRRQAFSGLSFGLVLFLASHQVVFCDNIRDPAQLLSEVSVYGTAGTVLEQPKNITIIDRQAILNAPSNSLIDLLSREANITLRSQTGHDKYGGVDIRGMGDSYSSNVLIMVNGVRLNAPDLSGADFSTLSLGQIERIEIIRGGGGVLYGDGAVGGVVNIVTRGAKHTSAEIYNSYGSFDSFDSRLNASFNSGDLSASLNAAHYQTDGYRENAFLDKNQLSSQLAYQVNQAIELQLNFRIHDDEYGLPGPVDYSAINNPDLRRQASTPYGGGETHDYAGDIGSSLDWGQWGITKLKLAYRYRDNPNQTASYWVSSQIIQPWKNSFDHRELDIRHQLNFATGPISQDWNFGYYQRLGSVSRRENGRNEPNQSRLKQADFDNQSGFINTQWSLPIPILFNAGYRHDSFALQRESKQYDQVCSYAPVFPFEPIDCENHWLSMNPENQHWRSFAVDTGLTWNINDQLSWYGSYNRSYRNPNPEELVLSADDIQPQHGQNWETGWRLNTQQRDELTLALFRMRNQQEIYFDNSINRNYEDATLRYGLELSGRFQPIQAISLSGSFGYINARFENTGLKVPLVPELKGQIGLLWHATARLSVSVSAEYIGSRSNGANIVSTVNAPKLEAYQKVDLKAFYQWGGAEIFAGINNLFNDYYTTSAYGSDFYPMPERHAYAGLTYTFPNLGN